MNRSGSLLMLFYLLLLSTWVAAQNAPLSLAFGEGKIKGSISSSNPGRYFFLETVLPQTKVIRTPQLLVNDSNSVITKQTIRYFDNECIVINSVTKKKFGLQWDIEIKGIGSPWTVPVETVLQWDKNDSIQFWTTWP